MRLKRAEWHRERAQQRYFEGKSLAKMALTSSGIATSERIGIADVAYVALTLALLLTRWVDIAKLNGMTIHALPATAYAPA